MFLNIKLPDDISMGAVCAVEWNNTIIDLEDGKECRNILSKYPKRYYTISYNVLNKTMTNELITFFIVTKGNAHSFLFRDWLDYEAKDQQLLDVTVANDNDDKKEFKFQLIKSYSLNDYVTTRTIKHPVKNTLRITNSQNKILEENIDYYCNYNTGVITFKEKPEDNLKAEFEFDIEVRFDIKAIQSVINRNSVYSLKDLILKEIS